MQSQVCLYWRFAALNVVHPIRVMIINFKRLLNFNWALHDSRTIQNQLDEYCYIYIHMQKHLNIIIDIFMTTPWNEITTTPFHTQCWETGTSASISQKWLKHIIELVKTHYAHVDLSLRFSASVNMKCLLSVANPHYHSLIALCMHLFLICNKHVARLYRWWQMEVNSS